MDTDGDGDLDQPQGPCVDGVPDRDNDPSDAFTRGWDWSEVDAVANRCHADSNTHGGDPRDPTEPEVNAVSDTTNCTGITPAGIEAGEGPVDPILHTDSAEALG